MIALMAVCAVAFVLGAVVLAVMAFGEVQG
jgi:hypothetical protein